MKLSHSSIDLYKQCPKRWYFHYILKYRDIYLGSPLFFGSAIGNTLAMILLSKKEELTEEEKKIWGTDPFAYFDKQMEKIDINGQVFELSTCPMIKYFKSDFQEDILNNMDWEDIRRVKDEYGVIQDFQTLVEMYSKDKSMISDDQLRVMNYHYWTSLRRKGHYIIQAYIEDILPKIKRVYSIEEPIEIKNDAGDSIAGFIDIVVDIEHKGKVYQKVIMDHKTSSKKYADNAIEKSQQLAFYNYAKAYNHVGYIVCIKEMKKDAKGFYCPTQICLEKANVTRDEKFIMEADEILWKIKNEEFPTNTGSCFMFGQPCPYKRMCQGDGSDEGLFRKSIDENAKK